MTPAFVTIPADGSTVRRALTRRQRLLIRLGTRLYLGQYQPAGWRRPGPFYAGRCQLHGYFANSLRGAGHLECPTCQTRWLVNHRKEATR